MKNIRIRRVLKVLGTAAILLEINPLTSEPIRLGVLVGVSEVSHNVALSAMAFGAVTFFWELACVIAAVELLDSRTSKKIIKHIRNTIGRVGLDKLMKSKTKVLTDFAITLVLGSPATIIIKHIQDPTRSTKENRRLGYVMSVGAGLIATIQGAAIVEGLWHPSVMTVAITVTIVGGSLAVYYYIKRHLYIGS